MPPREPDPTSPVDALSDGLVVVSASGLVLEANRVAREELGVAASTPVPPLLAEVWRAAAAGERGPVDLPVVTAQGPRTLSVTASRLAVGPTAGRGQGQDGGAEAGCTVLVLRDVTDEREQVDALSAFAGVVAHDVRGPISAMVGWSETALDALLSTPPADPVEVAALLARLHHGAQRLDRMVANLLLHATSRDRELQRAPVDLASVVEEVAEARDVRRWVEVTEMPKVSGDAPMLQHLMDNLVGNAVKFVPAGVEPRVVVSGTPAGGVVDVTVTDNGIGIPPGMREQVFQRFERVPGTGLGGTGMGLSICRTIVQRHGGEISVGDGPDGVGSSFRVRLPAAV
ncbi:unannotated protein [freshwater metagenome]|uniref:histidine kinase n=1 Tax=freshwater metagenome TaxID=449393 RepID=A0A6J6UJZ0_9ZZZZ|nr:hypothetical protein [Actinomycetota bacterium]